ncbi:hypothetical protein [Lutibacter maritimus]|uniref:Uncharacterized protein n=1 Tax=Lutibacter maritimus TaxID=593133 RepID=A0A1I6NYX0_9FLAO|nr:hypothetical protein [Lutibacter maritimus]SFS33154.1 hypothetical protein SAMN04488006_0731 [Lutibacter maritimus]
MDSSTLIIGLVMVALCTLPFILSGNSRTKNEQKIKNAFFELATKNNTTILQNDIWYKSAIGINTTSNELFFYRKIKDTETSEIIQLSDYQKCKIMKLNDSSNHIELLQLVLTSSSSNKPEIVLEFYNAELNPQLNKEVQLIEKWSKLINDTIHSSIKIKKAV